MTALTTTMQEFCRGDFGPAWWVYPPDVFMGIATSIKGDGFALGYSSTSVQ